MVPMILLTLIEAIRYRLILVSGCVMAFTILMGLAISVESKDLVSATAGYTAVLAVYFAVAGN